MLLKTVGLIIGEYNAEGSAVRAIEHIKGLGLNCVTELEAIIGTSGSFPDTISEPSLSCFVFTDSREAADRLKERGIGFAVYSNSVSSKASFPDALYMVEDIRSLQIEQIERMLLRFLRLPWTILETERLVVREITEEDVDALYDLYGDGSEFPYTEGLYENPEEERAYTRDYIDKQYRFFEYGIWIVKEKTTGRIVGRAGIAGREGFEDPELGYAFAPDCRRKGYAYEVCGAILEYAEKNLNLDSINAFSREENTASLRLLNKLGFTYIKKVMIDGKPHNMYNRNSGLETKGNIKVR